MTATDALYDDLRLAYARLLARRAKRRRLVVAAAVSCTTALALGAVAFGAARLLGWPAPGSVKNEITAVDRGLPPDLRLNPDVANARAVAASGGATLYAASLPSGGSCTEIVTDGRGRASTRLRLRSSRRPCDRSRPLRPACEAA